MAATELDPSAILTQLGYPTARVLTRVTGGADAAIWRVADGGQNYALRVLRAEQVPIYHAEQWAMRLAAASGVLVPEVVAAGVWQGRPALLLSWSAGDLLADLLAANLDRAAELMVSFGRMQATIHAVLLPTTCRRGLIAGLTGPPSLNWPLI